MEEKNILCPLCRKELLIDSIRKHKDGKKRVYWECNNCDLSIMQRNV